MADPQPDAFAIRDGLIVPPGKDLRLTDRPSRDETFFPDKEEAKRSLQADAEEIDRLQDALYAEGKRALLLILQGIDTSGKSGTTKAVFQATSPVGMKVTAFGAPTADELGRDFLWRVHRHVPPRGFIGVFDRSHYEDVLVAKVRNLAPPDVIDRRYGQINDFERLLVGTGTAVLKCCLWLSKDEQAERLRDRLETPHKRWKFDPADLDDRLYWDDYVSAYQTMMERCSTDHAPWFVVPADSKTRRNALVARLVRQTLEDMNPVYPKTDLRPDSFTV